MLAPRGAVVNVFASHSAGRPVARRRRGTFYEISQPHMIAPELGGRSMSNLEQVSVPLPPELRQFVRLVAEREERSQAAVIRRLVAAAARQSEQREARP
jgi:hypothetical protein